MKEKIHVILGFVFLSIITLLNLLLLFTIAKFLWVVGAVL